MPYYKLVDIRPGNEIHIKGTISDSEFRQFEKHRTELEEFYRDEALFFCLTRNYRDYQETIARELGQYIKNSYLDCISARRIYMNLNRLICNILASARMFLDHTEYNLKRTYGKSSTEFADFKKTCSHKYDTNISYRFLYKLRNFVQHCGMPVGIIEIFSTKGKQENSKWSGQLEYSNPNVLSSHTLSIFFDRDRLLESFKDWGKRVKSDLSQMEERIEVTQHIRSFISDLSGIHRNVIDKSAKKIKTSYDYLFDLAEPVLGRNISANLAIAVSSVRSERNWANQKIDFRYFPVDVMRYIREETYRNPGRDTDRHQKRNKN